MLTIYGRNNSSNVMKVVWAAEEIGVAYVRHDRGGAFGGLDTPEYRAMNPNQKIPTIDDDGFVLWESNAIVRYLGARYGAGGIWPEDLRVRADADRWMDWQQTTVGPPMGVVFWQNARTPPEKRDPALIAQETEKAGAAWAILDDLLRNRPFVAGDKLTMGDIPAGVHVHRWFALPLKRPDLPALSAWYERLKARSAYRANVSDIPVT
jgi:glutathione S-transferase